jgi:hypothetical protein
MTATCEYGQGLVYVVSGRSDVVLHAWSAVRNDRTNMTARIGYAAAILPTRPFEHSFRRALYARLT